MDGLGLEYLWKSVISLVVIIWAANFLLRKLSKVTNQGSKNMQIVERLPLSPKSSLCIVKVLDKYYLMSCTEQHNELIQELDMTEEKTTLANTQRPPLQQGMAGWKSWGLQVKERGQNLG